MKKEDGDEHREVSGEGDAESGSLGHQKAFAPRYGFTKVLGSVLSTSGMLREGGGRRASRRHLPLLVAVTLVVVVVAVSSFGSLWGAFKEWRVFQECKRVTTSWVLYDTEKAGWEVRCVPSINKLMVEGVPQGVVVSGLTDAKTQIIWVRQGSRDLKGVLVHEEGHAWAIDHLSAGDEERFSSLVGSPGWEGGRYETRGAEVWARGFAECQGFRDPSDGVIPPCSAVRKFLKIYE